jgi:hypothetical protein
MFESDEADRRENLDGVEACDMVDTYTVDGLRVQSICGHGERGRGKPDKWSARRVDQGCDERMI